MSIRRGYVYAIIAALSYSVVAVIGKFALGAGVVPEALTFWQYLLTSSILCVYFLVTDRTKLKASRKQLMKFAAMGILGGMLTNFFYYHALDNLSAGLASMLLFSAPFLINLFFIISGVRKVRPVFFLPIILGLLGNFLALDVLNEQVQMSTIGIIFGFLSAVFYAFYAIFMDLKIKNQNAHQMNMFATMFGASASGIYLLATNPAAIAVPAESLIWMLLNAVFAGVIPVYFAYNSLQRIGSDKFSVISTIELPLTMTMAFIFLNERLSVPQFFGMSMVVGSVVLLRMLEMRVHRLQAIDSFDRVK